MSLPVLPSIYRPVSVILFAGTGLIILVSRLARRSLPFDEFILCMFCLISMLQSVLIVGLINNDYFRSFRHLVVLLLGLLSYLSLKQIFRLYGIDYALKIMAGVYGFIFAVGVIEVLCIHHILPWSIKAFICKVLSGHVVPRVQLVTSEASWGAKVLLFGMPIYVFLYVHYKKKIYLVGAIISFVLFCYTLSLEGFVAGAIAVVLFALMKYRSFVAHPRYFLYVGSFVFGLAFVFYLSYLVFPKGGQYYLSRIQTLKTGNLERIKELPCHDASVFIRIYYPILGVWMFADRPWGVGVGGYSQYFKEYIDRVGIDYRNFPEVVNNIRMGNGDPKNLYSKWLAENGLISGWLLILFVGFHLYCLHYASGDGIITYRNLLIALLAVNFAILFQFGSYAYLPLWFTFAMNAEMERVHLLPSKAR